MKDFKILHKNEFCSSHVVFGYCPSLDTINFDGLCPKIPLKKAGIRIEPPMSEPRPNGEAAAIVLQLKFIKVNKKIQKNCKKVPACMAPSPPLDPPTIRLAS